MHLIKPASSSWEPATTHGVFNCPNANNCCDYQQNKPRQPRIVLKFQAPRTYFGSNREIELHGKWPRVWSLDWSRSPPRRPLFIARSLAGTTKCLLIAFVRMSTNSESKSVWWNTIFGLLVVISIFAGHRTRKLTKAWILGNKFWDHQRWGKFKSVGVN